MNEFITLLQGIRLNRFLRHLLFWLVFLFLDSFQFMILDKYSLSEGLIFNICALIPQITFTYLICYWIIPVYLRSRVKVGWIILFLVIVYLFAVLNRIMIVHVAEELMVKEPFVQESIEEIVTDWRFLLGRYIPSNLWVAMIFISIKYFFDRENIKKQGLRLDKEKAESELNALKAQLNPHFLFNTLNNIYSLSVTNSPKTSDAIGRLSDILDHVLYRSEGELVPLKREMDLVTNYIELEQLRYSERLKVTIDSEIGEEIRIPPLILLSLVENAFKHGAGEDSGSPEIDIQVRVKEEHFHFMISNSIAGTPPAEITESIGLTNIRKQLDLIYQNSYDLDISNGSERFKVDLSIPVNRS